MKGKLIKTGSGYILDGDNLPNPRRLSIQNCNEIFGIVDVDKLAKEDADLRFSGQGQEDAWLARNTGIIWGFNKSMELNKDKLFTVDQLNKAYYRMENRFKNEPFEVFLEHIQQPKEIEVEVVMDKIPADLAPGGWDVFPRLDKEGCIILKRVVC
jgi:hypothetical protein